MRGSVEKEGKVIDTESERNRKRDGVSNAHHLDYIEKFCKGNDNNMP